MAILMAKNCRKTSGYIIWMAECFKKMKEENKIPRQERMSTCAVQWKKKRPEEQIKYKEKATLIKAQCVAQGAMPTAPK